MEKKYRECYGAGSVERCRPSLAITVCSRSRTSRMVGPRKVPPLKEVPANREHAMKTANSAIGDDNKKFDRGAETCLLKLHEASGPLVPIRATELRIMDSAYCLMHLANRDEWTIHIERMLDPDRRFQTRLSKSRWRRY